MRVDSSEEPEQMIAALRSKRTLMLLLALGGIAVALGALFSAAGAMYAKDPVRDLQTEKAALEAAPQP
jgi:alcohol dehydrogenase YqhD (iron-dependent ADH family)